MPGRLRATSATGFTLLELVVATFVMGTVVVGLFGLVLLTIRTAAEGERRIVATALANEKMELVRNLAYVQVGTVGGVPSGPLSQTETVVRNGTSYTVRTDIRYVDDPYDGVAGGSGNECVEISHRPPGNSNNCQDLCVSGEALNAHLAHGDSLSEHCDGSPIVGPDTLAVDYKQVRIEASWASVNEPKPVLLITSVAPDGIEGGEGGGALDFQALTAAGNAVPAADVELVNDEVDPPVALTTQTNAEGRVVLPGLPPASGTYVLTVSKSGYTREQTYATTSTFIPDADHIHLSIAQGGVTPKTFLIDVAASLSLTFEEGGSALDDNECQPNPGQGEGQGQGQGQGQQHQPVSDIAYTLQGTKTIGVDGAGQPVYVVAEDGVSDNQGEASHEGLVWDEYGLVLDAAITCDIREASLPLPLSLSPGEEIDLTVRLVEKTPISLRAAAVTTAGDPVDNATVRLTATGFEAELVTGAWGQVFFADLPEVGQYTLEISAPGYQDFSEPVSVEGSAQTVAELSV